MNVGDCVIMSKRILYCWELGSGNGHISKIYQAAKSIPKNFNLFLSVKELGRVPSYFSPIPTKIIQSPLPIILERVDAFNYSDILYNVGFNNKESLSMLMSAWISIFDYVKPDLVLLDFAPTASLVAKSMGIKRKFLGTGFEIPPNDDVVYPSLAPWNSSITIEYLKERETIRLDVINKSLDILNYPPLESLSELIDKDNTLLTIPRGLDHYNRNEDWRYVNPARIKDDRNLIKYEWKTNKKKIYFYLSKLDNRTVDALLRLTEKYEIKGFARDISKDNIESINRKHSLLLNDMADLDYVLPYSDLFICNGGIGSLIRSGYWGIPTLIFPSHSEQRITAHNLASTTAVRCFDISTNTHMSLVDVIINAMNNTNGSVLQKIVYNNSELDYHEMINHFVIN